MTMPLLSSATPLEMSRFINPNNPVFSIATTDVVSVRQTARVSGVLETMLFQGFRRLPVTDNQGRLTGIVSETDVLNALGAGPKRHALRKGLETPVKSIMVSPPWYVPRTHTIKRALSDLRACGAGVLPVVDEQRPMGIISEYDFAVSVRSRTGLAVGAVMTGKPLVVKEEYPVREVARMLVIGPYRKLPVVQSGMLSGIVTPHDILSHLYRNRKLGRLAKDSSPVRDAMNRRVSVVHPLDDIFVAASRMRTREIGGLPVVDELDMVGIITKNDIAGIFG